MGGLSRVIPDSDAGRKWFGVSTLIDFTDEFPNSRDNDDSTSHTQPFADDGTGDQHIGDYKYVKFTSTGNRIVNRARVYFEGFTAGDMQAYVDIDPVYLTPINELTDPGIGYVDFTPRKASTVELYISVVSLKPRQPNITIREVTFENTASNDVLVIL